LLHHWVGKHATPRICSISTPLYTACQTWMSAVRAPITAARTPTAPTHPAGTAAHACLALLAMAKPAQVPLGVQLIEQSVCVCGGLYVCKHWQDPKSNTMLPLLAPWESVCSMQVLCTPYLASLHQTNSHADVNECLEPSKNNCHPDAVCSNTMGGFTCTCKLGFDGNGTSCTGEDEGGKEWAIEVLAHSCRHRHY
jgi:hypothetical protein